MTLSVPIMDLPETRKCKVNAHGDLVPNQCGEGSHDLQRLGNLHLQRRVTRSPARKAIARTVCWCWTGGVPKRCWVAIRVRSRDGVLSSHGGATRRVETVRSVETVRACLRQSLGFVGLGVCRVYLRQRLGFVGFVSCLPICLIKI